MNKYVYGIGSLVAALLVVNCSSPEIWEPTKDNQQKATLFAIEDTTFAKYYEAKIAEPAPSSDTPASSSDVPSSTVDQSSSDINLPTSSSSVITIPTSSSSGVTQSSSSNIIPPSSSSEVTPPVSSSSVVTPSGTITLPGETALTPGETYSLTGSCPGSTVQFWGAPDINVTLGGTAVTGKDYKSGSISLPATLVVTSGTKINCY